MAKMSDMCVCACGFPDVQNHLIPRAGQKHGLVPGCLQRSLSPQPAWGWEGTARQRSHLHRAECCFVSYLLQTTPPALQTEHQKRRQQTTSRPLPWDCIDRGGSSLQREVHLGCDFPAGFYSQQHWERRELRVQFSDQVLADLLSTVKREHPREAGGVCSFLPDCLGCRDAFAWRSHKLLGSS